MFTKNFELDTIFSKVIDDNNLTISKQEVVKHMTEREKFCKRTGKTIPSVKYHILARN